MLDKKLLEIVPDFKGEMKVVDVLRQLYAKREEVGREGETAIRYLDKFLGCLKLIQYGSDGDWLDFFNFVNLGIAVHKLGLPITFVKDISKTETE